MLNVNKNLLVKSVVQPGMSLNKRSYVFMASGLGLEPRLLGPKPSVLPLDDPELLCAILASICGQYCTSNSSIRQNQSACFDTIGKGCPEEIKKQRLY